MAKLLNKAPAEYLGEKERFLHELKLFHDGKGTPYRHLPTIDGLEIDLYQLYWIVTASGGWEKVNSRGGWEEIVTLFELPEATANAALALKHTYLRYLDVYEKHHFLGEEEDGDDNWYNDEEDSRTRRQKVQKITSSVPLAYNHPQHQVADEHREMYNLSTKIYKKTDYDRLILSLCSPLPNEQDFAINVCTLLSNEGRHTLKLVKCPRLLDLLLAHAGVYNHENLNTYLNAMYGSVRNYDLLSFWRSACHDSLVRDLMLQVATGALSKLRPGHQEGIADIIGEEPHTPERRLAVLKQRVKSDLSEESDIFAAGIDLGTREMAGQRILQIATIIRNLSFEEDNATILALNMTCIRFCLLCCSSSWSNLNQTGFDIIGNIASEINLEPNNENCCTETLLSTLTRCICSPDRFQVISSLDILCKLCQQDSNEDFIDHILVNQQFVFDQLVMYLSLHDIHLLISTIECLYSFSCLGESACNAIVRTHGALDALVSLVTVEAQSYGPKACILMRVVETVPGTTTTAAQPHQIQANQPGQSQVQSSNVQQVTIAQVKQPAITSTPAIPTSGSNATVQVSQQQSPQHPTTQQVTLLPGQAQQLIQGQIRGQVVQIQKTGQPGQPQVLHLPRHPVPLRPLGLGNPPLRPAVANIAQPLQQKSQPTQVIQLQGGQLVRTQQPALVQQHQQTTLVAQNSNSIQVRPLTPGQAVQLQTQPKPPVPAPPQPSSQQVQLRVSNDEAHRTFCLSWLRATYEAAPGSRIQHEIMYKQYLASLHKLGRREVISAQLYAACVRTLFGGAVGPNKRQLTTGAFDLFFEGVKVRPQPLALRIPAGQASTTLANNGTPTQVTQSHQTNPSQTPQPPSIGQPSQSPVVSGVPVVLNNKPVVVSIGQTLPSQPTVVAQHQSQAATASTATGTGIQQPGSPILTNLLHRGSPGPQDVVVKPNDQVSITTGLHPPPGSTAGSVTNENNGIFGVESKPELQEAQISSPCKTGNGMLVNLLDTDSKRALPIMNGMATTQEVRLADGKEVEGVSHLNGADHLLKTLKRPAIASLENVAPPAKLAMVKTNGLATAPMAINGPVEVTNGTGGCHVTPFSSPGSAMPILSKQSMIVSSASRLVPVLNSHAVTAGAASGGDISNQTFGAVSSLSGLPPLPPQPPNSKTIIILQPQNKTLTTSGGGIAVMPQNPLSSSDLTNGPTSISSVPLVNGQAHINGVTTPITSNTPIVRPTHPTAAPTSTPQLPQSPVSQSTPMPQDPAGTIHPLQQSVVSPIGSGSTVVASSIPVATVVSSVSSFCATSSSSVPTTPPVSSSDSTLNSTSTTVPKVNPQSPFLCEWQGCMQAFKTAKEVEMHAIKIHCPEGQSDLPCLWSRCDGMKRKRFSLMTHIQDRHCHPQLMKLMAVRRVQIANTGKSDVPLPPTPPTHPGYPPNAALHAIKRHAAEFAAPKAQAMTDEKEGPVTKSIRLTSSLILKNLVIYSSLGKSRLKCYESHLSTVALSNVESSRTISQILFEMTENESKVTQS